MNRGEIRTAMRNLLNEDSAGFWTDAKLNSYIDLANQRVNSIISTLREDYFTISATFLLQSGVKSYDLPGDCHFVRRLEIYNLSDPSDITKLDPLPFPRMEGGNEWPFTASERPARFVVRGTQFDAWPIPDQNYPARIYYDQRKDNFTTDNDVPASPVDFHDMLVYWGCVLAKKQNEEDDGGYVDLFNIRKDELIDMLQKRSGDDAEHVEGYLEGI